VNCTDEVVVVPQLTVGDNNGLTVIVPVEFAVPQPPPLVVTV
jgi:hypothetical protein